MSTTIDAVTTYTIVDCDQCGSLFGITSEFDGRRRKDGNRFYCPNGHGLSYTIGKTEKQKREEAERQAASAREEARIARIEADRARAAAATAKRELAKAKRTVAKAERAVCPVDGCQRSFVQMERHLRSQHPEFVHARDGH